MGKGLFGSEDCKKRESECEGCICDVLKTLEQGTVLRIAFLEDFVQQSGGNEIEFTFVCFDEKSCCVTLIDQNDDNAVLIDCRELIAIEIVVND